ncbi:hypothetical protein IGI04_025249 [Brassica rapa subsp. trilocularis]|uniref:Uncharacterized protein n=1 Tax=Brassica rapa subsp. trilocularis TaxID=1813537 RepID=A0ABQ7MCV9_BRACM|nr:hypothetical protein IGI04_025249 [Brassica rapa subsp. trilocularis]
MEYWVKVLRRLPFSAESDDGIFLEKIELLLQGRLASRWTQLIEGVMLVLTNLSLCQNNTRIYKSFYLKDRKA